MNWRKLQPSRRRPLKPAEQRLLRARLAGYKRNNSRASVGWIAPSLIFGVLWLATVLASDLSIGVITVFWLVVAAIVFVWVLIEGRNRVPWADVAVSILRRNEADVYDVRASAFIAFEEVDDEGALYAFQVEGNRIVFIGGQEFCPVARFPSQDFSIIHALDEEGRVRAEWIEKRGVGVLPFETISASMKRSLVLPDHLTILEGRVQEIETILRSQP